MAALLCQHFLHRFLTIFDILKLVGRLVEGGGTLWTAPAPARAAGARCWAYPSTPAPAPAPTTTTPPPPPPTTTTTPTRIAKTPRLSC